MHIPVNKLNRSLFKSDTETAIKRIEDLVGARVITYRAPAFSITSNNTWAFEVLAEQGIEIDCSILPSRHDYGGFPSFESSKPTLIEINNYILKELPINTFKFLNYDRKIKNH